MKLHEVLPVPTRLSWSETWIKKNRSVYSSNTSKEIKLLKNRQEVLPTDPSLNMLSFDAIYNTDKIGTQTVNKELRQTFEFRTQPMYSRFVRIIYAAEWSTLSAVQILSTVRFLVWYLASLTVFYVRENTFL
jgi:hypothetical protein